MFTKTFLILLIVAALISSIGFYKYVYFISLGYGFSICAIGISLLIIFKGQLTFTTTLCAILLILYGLRLGGYLLIRELKSVSYNRHMKTEIKDGKTVSFKVKIAIWISSFLLYVCQISPILYRIESSQNDDIISLIGACIMILGLIFETFADIQKNKSKKLNPNRFCDTGLYKIVRCPNYLGEMIFWTGVFVSSLTILHGGQIIISTLGYIGIIYIMFSGARRLEIRQNKNYGNDEEYKKYIKKTPILLPFIPLYSVEKYKWLVG